MEIGRSDRWILFYDKDTLFESAPYMEVSIRFDYLKPQVTKDGKTYTSKQDKLILECKNQKFLIQYSAKYSSISPSPVETIEFREADYIELFKESADMMVHRAICI